MHTEAMSNSNTNATIHTLNMQEIGGRWIVAGGVWLLALVALLLAGFALYSQIHAGTAFFILITCLGAGVFGFWHAGSMADVGRVMGGRAAPSALWRQWLLASIQQAACVWGVMVLGLFLVTLQPASPWRGLTPVAAASWVLAMATLLALAKGGLVRWQGWWILALAGLAWLAGLTLAGGVGYTLQWLNALPAIALWGMALAWPVLMGCLLQRWRGAPQSTRATAAVLTLPALWQIYQRRFVSIRVGGSLGATFLVVALGFLSNNPVKPTELAWGGSVTGFHLVCQVLLVMVCSRNLVCRDLHWRSLLAPGFLRGSSIGTRIVRSSLESAVGAVLVVCAFFFALEWVQSGFTVASLIDVGRSYALLPVQLVFSISLATLIRGAWPEWHWEPAAAVIALVVVSMLTVFKLLGVEGWAGVWIEAGYAYTLTLLALSGLALVLANRLWTVPKLAKFATLG